jgi:chromosome partitioning protein
MTHIFAVVNQKGGTAKTTTAVAVASKLALMGKRVLLVDMDPQGNSTMSFDIDVTLLEHTVFDALVHGIPMQNILLSTTIKGLHLAPGNVSLSKTDINLADKDRKQFRLKDILQGLLPFYDYMLIDCPPSYGLLPVNALVASTGVIVPMVPQYFALEGLKQIANSIENIRKELNPGLDITGILFCMVDSRLKITDPTIRMVRDHYHKKVFDCTIGICSKLNEANLMGKSIFEYDEQSRAAKEYAVLVDEILQKTQNGYPGKRTEKELHK